MHLHRLGILGRYNFVLLGRLLTHSSLQLRQFLFFLPQLLLLLRLPHFPLLDQSLELLLFLFIAACLLIDLSLLEGYLRLHNLKAVLRLLSINSLLLLTLAHLDCASHHLFFLVSQPLALLLLLLANFERLLDHLFFLLLFERCRQLHNFLDVLFLRSWALGWDFNLFFLRLSRFLLGSLSRYHLNRLLV